MSILHWGIGGIQSALAVVFTFGLVIFLHEFGHFLVCRRLKVRVERFAFGFGQELWGITRGETRYSINMIPLGGFVKPAGENLEDATGAPGEYFSKTWYERLAIVAAGPFMNYVLAFTLFTSVILVRGMPEPFKDAVIGEMASGFPAEVAGLKLDDKIVKVGGVEVHSWVEMANIIHSHPNQAVEIEFIRGDAAQHTTLTPRLDAVSGQGLIGIMPKTDFKSVGLIGSAKEGLGQCWFWTKSTVETLAEKIRKRERPDVAGPIGIVQMVSRAAHSGFDDLIFFIAIISVAVGFFNVLPIPMLDGGHGAFYVLEGISRKKPTLKMMTVANSIGIAILLSILMFATYNDILRTVQQHRERKAATPVAAPAANPK